MRNLFLFLLPFIVFTADAQQKVFDARYLQTPALYPFGIDSCQRFYFTHFKGLDSVRCQVTAHGDTAKYIRIYFSFVIDTYGAAYDADFERIASTQYVKSITSKQVHYFPDRKYYSKRVKEMIAEMPLWKPALLNGVTVNCRIHDYLQFWVGVHPPRN